MSEQKHAAEVAKYTPPVELKQLKEFVRLCNTDLSSVAVQIVGEGGENNLHSHNNMDGFWFVLEGRARFYGEGDKLIGDLGKYEGVLVPRGVPYWFESSGDVPLQILQAESKVQNVVAKRTDFAPLKASAAPFIGASGTIEGPRN